MWPGQKTSAAKSSLHRVSSPGLTLHFQGQTLSRAWVRTLLNHENPVMPQSRMLAHVLAEFSSKKHRVKRRHKMLHQIKAAIQSKPQQVQVRLSRLGSRGGQPHGSGALPALGGARNPVDSRPNQRVHLWAEDKDGRITLADFQGFVGRMGGAVGGGGGVASALVVFLAIPVPVRSSSQTLAVLCHVRGSDDKIEDVPKQCRIPEC